MRDRERAPFLLSQLLFPLYLICALKAGLRGWSILTQRVALMAGLFVHTTGQRRRDWGQVKEFRGRWSLPLSPHHANHHLCQPAGPGLSTRVEVPKKRDQEYYIWSCILYWLGLEREPWLFRVLSTPSLVTESKRSRLGYWKFSSFSPFPAYCTNEM